MERPLAGKRIAVLVDHKFIPEEIDAYRFGFTALGAEVHFVSRLWYGEYRPERAEFLSDVGPLDDKPWETPRRLTVERDVSQIRLADYAALLMAANYTAVRLRHFDVPSPGESKSVRALAQDAPAVKLFAEAMRDITLVKGALCHGLWILAAVPELLADRRVICHPVVAADVLNCGAKINFAQGGVVVDGDLVTGLSKHEVVPYIETVATQIVLARDAR